ncbi:MAG: GNAT family N-acetyltransferase [Planctomycetes bacterium]|nr:GNAT family N-acetyltransferase [Planctomycetota bacterium]MCP4769842.1 GNAT family N-acetyltransferase [Planctomycetota bacterium]MCP4859682.1 GNAT family N-acetyltransferase [Planctomycetota bacterium]
MKKSKPPIADPQSDEDVIALYPKVREPRSTDTLEYVHPEREDAPAIKNLINKVFKLDRDQAHHDWKYWDNPSGPPVGTLVREREGGRCLATGIGHPRRASVDGQDSCAALLCEVASDPDERNGGRLWREVMMGFSTYTNDVDGLHWAFGGQSTDEAIRVGGRWMAYRVIFELVSWEVRLSYRPSLKRHLGEWGSWAIPMVAPVLDFLVWKFWKGHNSGLELAEISDFNSDYDDLWDRYRHKYPVCFFRDAATLNWRYVANPLWKHRIVEARRNGELVGYLVWRETDDNGFMVATVLDFWHGDDEKVMVALIAEARRKAASTKCVSLRFALKEGRPEHEAYASFHSSRRSPYVEVDRVICTPIPGSRPADQDPAIYKMLRTVLTGDNWYYTQGDCDFRD